MLGVVLVLVATAAPAGASVGATPAYDCDRGACRVTSHSFASAIDRTDISYPTDTIQEWHFHVYFFQTNPGSVDAARWVQQQLLDAVARREMLAILPGTNTSVVPALDTSRLPVFNLGPIGPHPCGSFEVWVPFQYVPHVLSWLALNRGELSVLGHPLTVSE
eukprot:gene8876-1593_t